MLAVEYNAYCIYHYIYMYVCDTIFCRRCYLLKMILKFLFNHNTYFELNLIIFGHNMVSKSLKIINRATRINLKISLRLSGNLLKVFLNLSYACLSSTTFSIVRWYLQYKNKIIYRAIQILNTWLPINRNTWKCDFNSFKRIFGWINFSFITVFSRVYRARM